jgi:hypothetical protein
MNLSVEFTAERLRELTKGNEKKRRRVMRRGRREKDQGGLERRGKKYGSLRL